MRENRLLVTSSRVLSRRRECAAIPHVSDNTDTPERPGTIQYKERRFLCDCNGAFSLSLSLSLSQVFVATTASHEEGFLAVVRRAELSLGCLEALSRCVLCNGSILALDEAAATTARRGDSACKLPRDAATPLFACETCAQVFWWSERDNSSAARAAELASRLQKLAATQLAATLEDRDRAHRPESTASPCGSSAAELVRRLSRGVAHRLDDPLRSAMPLAERRGCVSNYVPNFNGQLDYILYSSKGWRLLRRRQLPTSDELKRVLGKCFLPCKEWPSDHILVLADLQLQASERARPGQDPN